MKNKLVAGMVIGAVLISAGSFYAGMKYSQISRSFFGVSGRNIGGRGEQMMGGNFNGGQNQKVGSRGNNSGMINGEIISKDDNSITVSMGNLGSKIIFLGEKTQFTKLASSSKEELIPGIRVMGQGLPNPDGSLNAENIQIR